MKDTSNTSILGRKIPLYTDGIGYLALVDCMGSDLDVINAARHSFSVEHTEFTEADRKLINYLWNNKHTTPFEHCVMKFSIKVPLYVAKQHMRHRTWSYNEISRRYTSVRYDEVFSPEHFRQQATINRQSSTDIAIDPVIGFVAGIESVYETRASEATEYHIKNSASLYKKLVDSGVCREQARGYLPQAAYTEYIATANLLNVLKFISLRNKPEAQQEIRVLATAMEGLVKECFPEVYSAYSKEEILVSEKNKLYNYITSERPDVYLQFKRHVNGDCMPERNNGEIKNE